MEQERRVSGGTSLKTSTAVRSVVLVIHPDQPVGAHFACTHSRILLREYELHEGLPKDCSSVLQKYAKLPSMCCTVLTLFSCLVADVLSEDTIIKWYKEAHSVKGKSVFLEQMSKFIEWLQNAEEGS